MKMMDEDRGYYFGFPKGRYTEALAGLACTKVNTCHTSSIPLAEFWQPANLGRIGEILGRAISGFCPESDLKYFEFPTEAMWKGEKIGNPSMTDLMIIGPSHKIAVEGKMTEYVRYREKTIRDWLNESERAKDVTLRRHLLSAWLNYIHEAGCTGIADYGEFFRDCKDVAYQFLHRTASACSKAGIEKGTMPVLVYQLFFDVNGREHIAKMEEFKCELRRWASLLKLRNMKFVIFSVPVTNMREVWERFGSMRGELFDLMQREAIYKFDFGGIAVETVLDAEMPKGVQNNSCRFSDIAALYTLCRPGLMDFIPAFVRRKSGDEPITYDHPLMEEVLGETYGILIYQEQLMALAQKLAGFSHDESDRLRRAMGKKVLPVMLEFKDKFVAGCLANLAFRVGAWSDEASAKLLCEKIWSNWASFAPYAFNKSRVASYVTGSICRIVLLHP